MTTSSKASLFIQPLISVIIPCYNHAHYLGKAIDSVLSQDYGNVEVVVVNDGSNDNTKEVAQSYGAAVRYVYKDNAGLSAARNTGIDQAKGAYVVFLDADDWLLPKALHTNLAYLEQNTQIAFVSGGYVNYLEKENSFTEVKVTIENDHYLQLLQGNYIGMIAAVMYRKWVLEEMRYDETLRACEDYDLYLRIACKYPVLHHTHIIACYRRHQNNMSANALNMLTISIRTLQKQRKYLSKSIEKQAYKKGLRTWKNLFCGILFDKLFSGENLPSKKKILISLIRYKPSYFKCEIGLCK